MQILQASNQNKLHASLLYFTHSYSIFIFFNLSLSNPLALSLTHTLWSGSVAKCGRRAGYNSSSIMSRCTPVSLNSGNMLVSELISLIWLKLSQVHSDRMCVCSCACMCGAEVVPHIPSQDGEHTPVILRGLSPALCTVTQIFHLLTLLQPLLQTPFPSPGLWNSIQTSLSQSHTHVNSFTGFQLFP